MTTESAQHELPDPANDRGRCRQYHTVLELESLGPQDVRGTLNFIGEAKRCAGAAQIRRGVSFSLAQRFDADGPQKGAFRRNNPVHVMLASGLDSPESQRFPHGLSSADDVVFAPLQASTQWDGLGHIFDHGTAWNGRAATSTVTSQGDLVTGIERVAADFADRGVLLDVATTIGGDGELPDGFAITPDHLAATIAAQGKSAQWAAVTSCASAPASSPAPAATAGATMRVARPRACRSAARTACMRRRSPRSPPTPGVSRSGRTSSTRRSSPCIRS